MGIVKGAMCVCHQSVVLLSSGVASVRMVLLSAPIKEGGFGQNGVFNTTHPRTES
jgi:hypothetical protein